ncbi:hypothetical protein BKA62DRAFT_772567 [Auriculariales sp. MPI-PUGE-AT-0066]|nr:hypothetical protein BKA62DRAFT_772567 [Auriculariales sp. MPI-PUGE-AT-0066]
MGLLKNKSKPTVAHAEQPDVVSSAKAATKRKRTRARARRSPALTASDLPSIASSSNLTSPPSPIVLSQLGNNKIASTSSPGPTPVDELDLLNDSDWDAEYGVREPTRLSVFNATGAVAATASSKKKGSRNKSKAVVVKIAVESAANVASKRKQIGTRAPSSPSPTPSQLSDVPSIFTSSSLTSPTSSIISGQVENGGSAFTDSPGRAAFDLFNDSDRDGEYNLRLLAAVAEAAAAATRPMSLAERFWHPYHPLPCDYYDGSAWPSADFLQPQPAYQPGTETSDAEEVTGRLQPCDWQHDEDEQPQLLPTVDEYLGGDSYEDTPAAQFQQSQRLPTVEEYLGSDWYEELAQETEAVVEQRRRGALKIKIVFRGHAVCELTAVCH